jgi:photosystem II stability/assembly factor-like uncharacterized protein
LYNDAIHLSLFMVFLFHACSSDSPTEVQKDPLPALGFVWDNPRPQGSDLRAVSALDANTYVGVGVRGAVVRSTDGGQTWTPTIINSSPHLGDVDFKDDRRGIAGSFGAVWVTSNGGVTWQERSVPAADFIGGVEHVAQGVWVAVGQQGAILRSNNDDNNWVDQSVNTTRLRDVAFVSSSEGWIVGSGSMVLHTDDAGATWTPQDPNVTSNLISVFFLDENTGWACGFIGSMTHTTDGGATWTAQTTPGTSPLRQVHFFDANNGLAFGGNGIIETSNGGATWTLVAGTNFFSLEGNVGGVFQILNAVIPSSASSRIPTLSYGRSKHPKQRSALRHLDLSR